MREICLTKKEIYYLLGLLDFDYLRLLSLDDKVRKSKPIKDNIKTNNKLVKKLSVKHYKQFYG